MMTGATTRSLQVWIVPSLICFRIWLPREVQRVQMDAAFPDERSCSGKKRWSEI